MFINDDDSHEKKGAEKRFGILFTFVFMLIGLYPLVDGEDIRLWAVSIAIIFFAFSFIAPNLLIIPNKLWLKFGIVLGTVMSPIVLILFYSTTFLPIGIFMRLIRNDLLRLKLNNNLKSYWIKRNQNVGSMKNQF